MSRTEEALKLQLLAAELSPDFTPIHKSTYDKQHGGRSWSEAHAMYLTYSVRSIKLRYPRLNTKTNTGTHTNFSDKPK